MSMTERFGELRSLLMGAPSAWRWRFLCALLDEAPDQAWLDEQAIPYAERALADWPDDLRVAPLDWVRRAADGAHVPALRLARALRDMPELVGRYKRTAQHPRVYPLPVLEHITALEIRADGTPGQLAEVLERLPGVTDLTCSGGRVQEGLLGSPEVWRRLRRLRLVHLDPEGVQRLMTALVESGACASIEVLELIIGITSDPAWRPALAEVLARHDWPALRRLELMPHSHADSPLATLLARAPNLHALVLGDYWERSTVASWWQPLQDSPCAAQLRELRVSNTTLPVDLGARLPALETLSVHRCLETQPPLSAPLGLRALHVLGCDASVGQTLWHDPALEHLRVSHAGATAEDLTRWLMLPRLHTLQLDAPDEGLALRAPAEGIVAPLRTLLVKNVRPDAATLQALGEACGPTLETLGLEMAGLGPAGASTLAACELPALRRLGVVGDRIDDAGFAALLGAPWFEQLRALVLHHNGLSAEAFGLWASAPHAHIEALGWVSNDTQPDAEAAAAFFDSPALASLRILDLGVEPISRPLAAAIRRALPRLWALRFARTPKDDVQRYASPRLEHLDDELFEQQLRSNLVNLHPRALRKIHGAQEDTLRGTPWFDVHMLHPPGRTPVLVDMAHVFSRAAFDWSSWWEWS